MIAKWLRRARALVWRNAIEDSMDAEMRYHVERETEERIAAGMPPSAARRSALNDFGGIERYKEEGRDARGTRPLEDAARDLRYAVRLLHRYPGFTIAITLTLALGVGAATAILSLVYGVLIRPLPYAESDRLVAVWEHNRPRSKDRNVVSVDTFETWRERVNSFGAIAALVPRSTTLPGEQVPERIPGAEVSPGYFQLLGIAPALGREFTSADEAVLMISDGLWRRRFGADPAVIGKTLPVAGVPHTIVGIMPAGFDPPRFGWLGAQDLWFPFRITAQTRSWGRFLLVVARLRPGATIGGARTELEAIARQRERESPANEGWSAAIVTLHEQIVGQLRTPLLAVLCGAVLLLLLAVANVATLSLSLLKRRADELAVRRAIGATDARLFRQLFVQSAVLGALGTAVGLLAALPGVRLLLHLLPPDMPRTSAIALDGTVLAISVGVAAIATTVFGTAAAVRGGSAAATTLGTRQPPSRASRPAGGGALVGGEIAVAVSLSVLALLMTRSVAGLRSVDLGFDPRGVVAARVAASPAYDTPDRERAFFEALVERFRAVPSVRAAGVISTRPFGGLGPATTVWDVTRPAPSPGQATVADVRYADRGFFATVRIPLIAGTLFDPDPRAPGPPAAVINESMARTLWPGEEAVGRRFHLEMFGGITVDVSGVVGDVHLVDARTAARPTVYLSVSRFPDSARDVVVRADGDGAGLVPSLRSALASVDPALPLYQVDNLARSVDAALATERFTMFLLVAFAEVALLLASVGIFGVLSSDVAARRREIGIRIALGAGASNVVGLLLRRALSRAVVGIAAGSLLALVLARSMSALLFGVSANDPLTFLSAAGCVLMVTVVATLMPACHAVLASPLQALREG